MFADGLLGRKTVAYLAECPKDSSWRKNLHTRRQAWLRKSADKRESRSRWGVGSALEFSSLSSRVRPTGFEPTVVRGLERTSALGALRPYGDRPGTAAKGPI